MPNWMLDIYAVLRTPVPFPKQAVQFALTLLGCYSLAMLLQTPLAVTGMHPAAIGWLGALVINLWRKMPVILADTKANIALHVLGILLLVCAAIIFAPSLYWVQRGYSCGVLFILTGFVICYAADGPNSFPWFAQHWPTGQRNAANWFIIWYVALLTINEAMMRHATATEWLISIALLPAIGHYLLHWTIIATHPYEEDHDA